MCLHKDCGGTERVWLPYENRGMHKGLKAHPYCIHCGTVKNISPDKAKDIGYFINILSKIEKRLENKKITQVQMRLIIKELEDTTSFKDTYGINKTDQEKIFIKTVRKHCNLPERLITEAL
jgi:hypothetical protein